VAAWKNLRENYNNGLTIDLPYCHKCGKEISEDARFCPNCGTSQVPTPRQEVVVKTTSPTGIVAAVVIIVILVGGLIFATTVEAFDCPRCSNNPWLKWACSYCDYDGKVTLIQLLTYSGGRVDSVVPSSLLCVSWKSEMTCSLRGRILDPRNPFG